MHRAAISISSETIVDLAQCALITSGIKCEWIIGGRDPCPVVLACWHALKQVSGKLPKISMNLGSQTYNLLKHYLSHVFVYRSKKQVCLRLLSYLSLLNQSLLILSFPDEAMFMLYPKMQCTNTHFTRSVAKTHRNFAYGSYQPFLPDKQWVALPISPGDATDSILPSLWPFTTNIPS